MLFIYCTFTTYRCRASSISSIKPLSCLENLLSQACSIWNLHKSCDESGGKLMKMCMIDVSMRVSLNTYARFKISTKIKK